MNPIRTLAMLLVLSACGAEEPEEQHQEEDASVDGSTSSMDASTTPGCKAEPVGLEAVTRFDRLAYLRSDVHARAFTSSDPSIDWNNQDYSNYLAATVAEATLFEAEGPGFVSRFWHTENPVENGEYRFYFDGETSPSLVLDRAAFRSAMEAPFDGPFTLGPGTSSGGSVTYRPIGFARSLRITETNPAAMDYYQIEHRVFADGRAITSGLDDTALAAAKSIFENVGARPTVPRADESTQTGVIEDVAAGQSRTFVDLAGTSEIVALRFHVPLAPSGMNARSALASARLVITWDDESSPAVDAPFTTFFGHGTGVRDQLRALPVGNAPPGGGPGDFYSYFPMPFASRARIALAQAPGGATLRGVEFTVVHRPFPAEDLPRVGRFRTVYRVLPFGTNVIANVTNAAGSFVGLVLVPAAGTSLEGDERSYVEGSATPFVRGTGMEDYFNGAWYYNGGSFTRPTHGAVLDGDAPDGSGRVSQYRFLVSDAVHFGRGFRLTWEITENSQALSYFYLRSTPTMVSSDELDVGDAASESAHAYTSGGAMMSTASWLLESNLTETGRRLDRNETSTFTVAIDPANDGVTLRRRYDAREGTQSAEVSVNGESVGTWTRAEMGPTDIHWREDDFHIPASETRGRSSLTIRVRATSDTWSEHRYFVFSEEDVRSGACR